MYADYSYYVNVYHGTQLTEQNFPQYAERASEYIDYITFGKAKKSAELPEVKKCCCALAEQYETINAVTIAARAAVTDSGQIQSESVGAHSRSFRSGVESAETITAIEAEVGNIARRYLLPTGLWYRGGVSGVCPTCCNSL